LRVEDAVELALKRHMKADRATVLDYVRRHAGERLGMALTNLFYDAALEGWSGDTYRAAKEALMLLKGVTQTPRQKPGAGGAACTAGSPFRLLPPRPRAEARGWRGVVRVVETPRGTGGTATARPVSQGGGTSGRRLEARIDRETERGFVIGIHDEAGEFVAAVAVYRPLRVAVVATSDMGLWQKLRPAAEKYEKDEKMADEDLLQAVREAVRV
jgi:hypothetical protein